MRTFDEVLAELTKLTATGARKQGAWPFAWVLEHCAQSIEYSLSGYPVLRSGLFRATIGRIAKRKFLSSGAMSHDCEAAITGAPALSLSDTNAAADRLTQAIAAFRAHEGALADHLAYGACSKADYEALHAMHVADHFSKLNPS